MPWPRRRSGAPASGDAFAVQAAATRDVFATINDLITVLRTGQSGVPASAAAYQNGLNTAMTNIDNALDKVLTVRASTGVRLRELDTAEASAADIGLNHETNLSRLQDLDYAQAISKLTQEQIYLEAAQKSFMRITSLRLFDFI